MNGKNFFGMAVLAASLVTTAQQAAAADLWLHIDVNSKSDKGDQANINLPLSMVRNMAPMLEDKGHDGNGKRRLHVRNNDLSVNELRQAWREIANGPDVHYITVRDKDSDVQIGKQGNYLRLKSKDSGKNGEEVDIKVPLDVVAALFSSDGDDLNFSAALDALARRGEGELLTVNGNDESVRIWVDSRSGG